MNCPPTEWDKWGYRTVCKDGWHRTEFTVYQTKREVLELFKLPLRVESWYSEPCFRTVHQETKERFEKAEAIIDALATILGCQTKEVFDRIKRVDDHVYEMKLEIYHMTESKISMVCNICGVMRGWVTPLRTPMEKIAALYKLHLQGIHPEVWNNPKRMKEVIQEKYL
jgi:hypothetical protein